MSSTAGVLKPHQLAPVWHALWLRCKTAAEIAASTAAEATKHGNHGKAAIAQARVQALHDAMGWIAEAGAAPPPPPAPPAPAPPPEVPGWVIDRARDAYRGKWPEHRLGLHGVMFYDGYRITRHQFQGKA
ncbi:MAG: hypothetical protein IIZ92_24925 [Aquincola sp.]|nr:hypothetical protein [Aquincola sp.]